MTTASSSMTYYYTQEEQTSALLYMYSNMEEMDPYFMEVSVVFLTSLVKYL
jgi:uncharacterized protein (DUF39 family)